MAITTPTGKTLFKNPPTLYSLETVNELIDRYMEAGGDFITLEEGSLGYGLSICYGEGLKTAVIKEIHLNEWSSGHTIRLYNKTPQKYEKLIERYFLSLDEE